MLFGSLARGVQTPGSDIDLVAIFDDLDYPTRWTRKAELQQLAGEAAGCDVDVRVTDWPEWAIRTRTVTTSLESRIARDAVTLWAGTPRGVNWDKETGWPATKSNRPDHRAGEALRGEDPRHPERLGPDRTEPYRDDEATPSTGTPRQGIAPVTTGGRPAGPFPSARIRLAHPEARRYTAEEGGALTPGGIPLDPAAPGTTTGRPQGSTPPGASQTPWRHQLQTPTTGGHCLGSYRVNSSDVGEQL